MDIIKLLQTEFFLLKDTESVNAILKTPLAAHTKSNIPQSPPAHGKASRPLQTCTFTSHQREGYNLRAQALNSIPLGYQAVEVGTAERGLVEGRQKWTKIPKASSTLHFHSKQSFQCTAMISDIDFLLQLGMFSLLPPATIYCYHKRTQEYLRREEK